LKKFNVRNLDAIDQPIIEELEIEIASGGDIGGGAMLINPFLFRKWKENPFKSTSRQYPVDFGTPLEVTSVLYLETPPDLEAVNLPENVAVALPNAGGKFLLDAKNIDNKITISNSLVINKTVFSSQEYFYLRELITKVVDSQNTEIMFKKKT
jgi:hypothetical protein